MCGQLKKDGMGCVKRGVQRGMFQSGTPAMSALASRDASVSRGRRSRPVIQYQTLFDSVWYCKDRGRMWLAGTRFKSFISGWKGGVACCFDFK